MWKTGGELTEILSGLNVIKHFFSKIGNDNFYLFDVPIKMYLKSVQGDFRVFIKIRIFRPMQKQKGGEKYWVAIPDAEVELFFTQR